MNEVFSEAWVLAWADELKKSEPYRQAAATWEGSIALRVQEDAEGMRRAVFLDLRHGECLEAKLADDAALDAADFLLGASEEAWKKVLDGNLEPIFGLMTGQLKLERGSLAALTPHMAASKELVAAATRVPAYWP